MKFGKSPLSKKFQDKIRMKLARMKGQDTYIDSVGKVRYARRINAGHMVSMPLDHWERVRKYR
jgi:hypothetical protein